MGCLDDGRRPAGLRYEGELLTMFAGLFSSADGAIPPLCPGSNQAREVLVPFRLFSAVHF